MQRPRPGIGAELVPLLLVLASLGGTVALVVATQKRFLDDQARKAKEKADERRVVVAVAPPPPPGPVSPPAPPPAPKVEKAKEPDAPTSPPPPAKPPEDPTAKALAKLRADEAARNRETRSVLDKARDVERALQQVDSRAEAVRRELRESRAKTEGLIARADKLEIDAAKTSIEVDVLEKRREETKAAVADAAARSSYAILPHRGPNGTWRRPIVIECHDGQVTLRPQNLSYGLGELMELGYGNSTFRGSVAREAVRIQRGASPDGRSVVPYFYFLVRPDGIKSYYAARRQLEPLGIAFGYELADEDWEIEYPDLDDPSTWTGESPTPAAVANADAKPGSGGGAGTGAFAGTDPNPSASGGAGRGGDNPFVWPAAPAERGSGRAGGPPPALAGPLGPAGSGAGENGAGDDLAAFGGPTSPGMGGTNPDRGLRQGLGAGGSGVTGASPDAFMPGAEGLPAGAGELPPGLGEAVPSLTPYEKEWAKELARRGVRLQPDLRRPFAQGTGSEGLGGEETPTAPGTGAGRGSATGSAATAGTGGTEARPGAGGGAETIPPTMGNPGAGGSGGGGQLGFGSSNVESFEIVVACESRGVVIHPGDYRVTTRGLAGKEPLFTGQLKAMVKTRRDAEPGKIVVPSITFLVEPGGHSTYSTARTQLFLDGVDWPTSLRISGGDVVRGLSREDW